MGIDNNSALDAAAEATGEMVVDLQRRRVLDILHKASEPMGLADLARELARQETSIEQEDDWEQAKQYHIELYHHHVPKLANTGYVSFDREQRTVALGSNIPDETLDGLAGLYH